MRGIYILEEKNEIVYIGKSISNMINRIRTHTRNKTFDKATLHEIHNMADLAIIEIYLISIHTPRYNVESKTLDQPTIEVSTESLLSNGIDVSVEIEAYRASHLSDSHDFKIAIKVWKELISDGYSYEDIQLMLCE